MRDLLSNASKIVQFQEYLGKKSLNDNGSDTDWE